MLWFAGWYVVTEMFGTPCQAVRRVSGDPGELPMAHTQVRSIHSRRLPWAKRARPPQGRWQQFDWCMCGALNGIIDGQGNRTGFTRDVQGRVTAKTYADNTAIGYVYEQTTSRLKKKTDPNQQSQTYTYTVDDNLAGIAYTIPEVQPPVAPTPNTSYTYEAAYNRLSTASVTGGEQTTYSYYPVGGLGAGKPSSIAGSFYTLGFTYDELGRRLSRSVDAGNTESYTYDALGRTATVTNNLGAFTYAYVNATDRLQSITSPSSPIATAFTYYGSGADERLVHSTHSARQRQRSALAAQLHLRCRRPHPHLAAEPLRLPEPAPVELHLR